jgi:hypothetical protein
MDAIRPVWPQLRGIGASQHGGCSSIAHLMRSGDGAERERREICGRAGEGLGIDDVIQLILHVGTYMYLHEVRSP